MLLNLALVSSLGMGLLGCGTGLDPLTVLDNSLPALGSFVSTGGSYSSYLIGGFSASNSYWLFQNSFASYFSTAVAPATGIVFDTGVVSLQNISGYYVSIIHSGRLMSRLFGLQVPTVHVGDSVVVGQTIGTFYSGSQVAFQVLVDGVAVCPLSYMSAAGRAGLTNWTPCQ